MQMNRVEDRNRSIPRARLVARVALVGAAVLLATPVVAQSAAEAASATADRLFFLGYRGEVLTANPDGSNLRVLAKELPGSPDGIAVDPVAGHIYWSTMGVHDGDDGTIMRSDLDGGSITTIIPSGGTFTAKQLTIDVEGGKLYWSDREGMRVQRANLDGSRLETLVEIASGDDARKDAANWAVGVAVDRERGQIYWSQKGGDNAGVGSIRRASIEIPAGQTASTRRDIEVLFSELPEPIDLELDHATRRIYWTDRGDAPRGNTVNRAPMDPAAGFDPAKRGDIEILMRDIDEAIGIAIDIPRDRMYVTDLGGNLRSARMDGSDERMLATGLGLLTGITVVNLDADR